LRGALAVGSPEQVVEKILYQHEFFRHTRFIAQVSGVIPHRAMMRHIELLGTEVAPVVRREIAARSGASGVSAPGSTPATESG